MNRKLKYQAAVLLLAGSLACMSGCGNKWVLEDPSTETDTMDMVTDIRDTETETEEIMETEVEGETAVTEDDIFRWGGEEYFPLFHGDWTVAEYAGKMEYYHFDEAHEEGYMEELWEQVKEVTSESIGSEFHIETDNLASWLHLGYEDCDYVIEDNKELFYMTWFVPDGIELKPPYIGVKMKIKDKNDWYDFIADAKGTVLVKMEFCFFRLEKKEE